eukprot:CAMPEP_0184430414 /NCGR_PEP_ID=MMETSP0738-20130409/274128_1 /TAXON_ID=385413 /ORGANISM="Thalassiosira miniscula, Strain CCMP1093" /LENGTH=50 /DNA_ID=CAMNT_0026794985 /DNA_START=15 /DNA_END=163 /DNA_ORIENTATION=+
MRHDSINGFHLGALGLFGLIAQTFHQRGELFKRHARDRQHIGLRLEPAAR